MTSLSININKIALLRNSRGRNYPDLEGVDKINPRGILATGYLVGGSFWDASRSCKKQMSTNCGRSSHSGRPPRLMN
ncbi:pyridoxine 5'-phosphate synthase [Cupriavidus necator]|uniref:pyridoxine 5'-phosphate synthase n=1 Tax=Cupriavidus necator TaxID=106590 RepID=UPI0039C014D8